MREDGKLNPHAIKINKNCKFDEICTKLDINETIPVKVLSFKVRSHTFDEVYNDSNLVTVRVVCHNDYLCKKRSEDFDHWIKKPCDEEFKVIDENRYYVDMVVNLNQTYLISRQNLTSFISHNSLECPLKNITIV